MVLADLESLPSLGKLFEHHQNAYRIIDQAGFRHIIELMCMPEKCLEDEIEGVGPKTTKLVSSLLRREGIERHQYTEHMSDYLEHLFGSLDKAPLMALNVVSFSGEGYTRVLFAPLRLLWMIEQTSPGFTVGEFWRLNRVEYALDKAGTPALFGPEVGKLARNYHEANRRIDTLTKEEDIKSAVKLYTPPTDHHAPRFRVVGNE